MGQSNVTQIHQDITLIRAGIEWLNDTTLHLLFPSPSAALLGLTLLSKAGFDPSEGDDPLLERAAHSVPISLLPMAEPEPVDSLEGTELITDESAGDGGAIKRKGRGRFGGTGGSNFDLEPLVSPVELGFDLAPGVDPNARIAVRYGTEGDTGLRKEAKQSEWYQRHGRGAGKERSTAPRATRREKEEAVSWDAMGGEDGREFAKRIGRERVEPYARPRREKTTQGDLDRELEGFAVRRAGGDEAGDGMDVDDGGRSRRGGRDRVGRGKEDLDRGEPEK